MIINSIDHDHGSWTRGVSFGACGIALLWYRPRQRLGLSLWLGWRHVAWSRYVRFCGKGAG